MADGRLYERFECAPGLKLAAHERLSEIQFDNIRERLDRLEEVLHRLEKRLWLAVYGIAGAILVQGAMSIMEALP